MAIRDDILRAAARVFSEQGYDGATLDEVAGLIGIKKGSLYYHIRSKEDLLFALHQRLADELIANTRAAVQEARTPQERLRAVLRVAMRLIAEHKEEVTVFLHERRILTSGRWQDIVAQRDAYQHMLEHILAEGIAQGIFRPLPVNIVALGLLGMTNWGYQWFRPDGPLDADTIAEIFADIALNGLRMSRLEESWQPGDAKGGNEQQEASYEPIILEAAERDQNIREENDEGNAYP